MNAVKEERRKYERIVFSDKDGMTGIFKIQEPYEKFVTVHIMDLGEEGMGVALEQNTESEQLYEEEHVILTELQDHPELRFLLNVEMEVRWTLNLKYPAAGCEFVNISQSFRDQIREVIHCWDK